MITWIIGRGLLGSAVSRRAGHQFDAGPIPWTDPARAQRVLHERAREFPGATSGEAWRVVWSAGAATTSTDEEATARELELLGALVHGLRSALPSGPGVFFLTSSAGGVYAGATHPPFDASTPPAPISAYGRLKVAQEELVTEVLSPVCPVVIGRLSNLYGPGQDLGKLQGLISRLALSAVTRQPTNVFVPLDTIRDYIYVDDAAAVIDAHLTRVIDGEVSSDGPEIIGSGDGTTVGQLIGTMNQIAKRKVPVALGTHASSAAQAPDLRLRPTLTSPHPTALPVGVKRVYLDILERVQRRSLAG